MTILNSNQLFDSHCHLNSQDFNEDIGDVVARYTDSGVSFVVDVATDLASSQRSLGFSKKYSGSIYSALGVHPEVFVPGSEQYLGLDNAAVTKAHQELDQVEQLIIENIDNVVMIGETGVDLYWLKMNNVDKDRYCKSKEYQIGLFVKHIELAKKYNLPLTIHHRDALDVCLNALAKSQNVSAIFHSFVGNYQDAKKILDAGYKLGINGIITYKSAREILTVIKKIIGTKKINSPKDLYQLGIYLETDSPFLGVEDLRGKRNEPKSVQNIYNILH